MTISDATETDSMMGRRGRSFTPGSTTKKEKKKKKNKNITNTHLEQSALMIMESQKKYHQ
jgi:hypothetical protein